jgi:ribonuclease HII
VGREVLNSLVPGIGGVDEAGRGPLAGPVIAAVVVLRPDQLIKGAKDSKQLSAARRVVLAEIIKTQSLAWSVGRAEVEEIDDLNILHASMLAMRRAIETLAVVPGTLRIDGNRAPELPGYSGVTETWVGGDRLCNAIASASILAKVSRDQEMLELDREFPNYGFAKHKGYPTAAHRDALIRYGPCLAHRRSFRPVKEAAAGR